MSMLSKIKNWLKVQPRATAPVTPPTPAERIQDMPNGRRVRIDEKGNFLGFAD